MSMTIGEASREVGVHPDTLKRWMKEGKIPEVKRDRNGWFIFERRDVNRAKAFANKTIPPNGNGLMGRIGA